MQQPKFKFGDRVSVDFIEATIIVNKCEFRETKSDGSGEYFYNGGYWEYELSEYKQPQKKKLYAYRERLDTEKIYFLCTNYIHSSDRAPEYDIEYKD